jgi:hypothetical protein
MNSYVSSPAAFIKQFSIERRAGFVANKLEMYS